MRKLWYLVIFVFLGSWSFAAQSVKALERYNPKYTASPCVTAFLNGEPLQCGSLFSKKSKGIITVSKDNVNKIYFNITLKSNIGKKDEPPIYLRFIKQKSIDIADILEYAEDGDEVYIEEYVSSLNKIDMNCSPAYFTIDTSL